MWNWAKHYDQQQYWKARIHFGYRLPSITEEHLVHHGGKPKQELKVETWRWELKQGPQRNSVYGRASCFHSVSFLIPPRTTCPGGGNPHPPPGGLLVIENLSHGPSGKMMEVAPLIAGLSQCDQEWAIMSHAWTHGGHTQKTGCHECWCSVYLLFIPSVAPGHRSVPHTFRASFPTATYLVEKNPSQSHQEVYF